MPRNRDIDVERYRDRVRLDEPFPAPAPAPGDEEGRTALVDSLLEYLRVEGTDPGSGEGSASLPTYQAGRRRLRALLTVRPPDPLPAWFDESLDRLLQRELLDRGTVEAETLPRISESVPVPTYGAAERCALWLGDITTLRIDAVVNAANSALLGCFQPFHACIDNAIHSAAGPRLREDCHTILQLQGRPEGTGLAKVTRGYNLPARYVIHTVGPVFRKEDRSCQERQLADCYRSCLEVALQVPGIRSVAFCCISTGIYGFPPEPAARVALSEVENFLVAHPHGLDLVVFNVFRLEDYDVYAEALRDSGQ